MEKIVSVTPEFARELLRTRSSPTNRPINRVTVEGIKSALKIGTLPPMFRFLRFLPDNGLLVDGHHRATAISEMPDGFAINMTIYETPRLQLRGVRAAVLSALR
jgi:hypothetical protein